LNLSSKIERRCDVSEPLARATRTANRYVSKIERSTYASLLNADALNFCDIQLERLAPDPSRLDNDALRRYRKDRRGNSYIPESIVNER
jgi:hypothetical protein